jgi:hypothetical protein
MVLQQSDCENVAEYQHLRFILATSAEGGTEGRRQTTDDKGNRGLHRFTRISNRTFLQWQFPHRSGRKGHRRGGRFGFLIPRIRRVVYKKLC